MGLTVLTIGIANPTKPERMINVEFLIDSGAIYSVVPANTLKKLGIKPYKEEEFRLADGSKVKRKIGAAMFKYQERSGVGDVIFGKPTDSTLFGALSMESLGLFLDPLKRELKPLPMMLA